MCSDLKNAIQSRVLAVHQRNGGSLDQLDWNMRLLDPVLLLDSLDLAEIMVDIERQHGRSPFDSQQPPKTWGNIVEFLTVHGVHGTQELRKESTEHTE